jgi:hypothetical protein
LSWLHNYLSSPPKATYKLSNSKSQCHSPLTRPNVIETSPSLLLIHWQICLVFMNTVDMGVFLIAQNMLGTTDVTIKICNFKVPSYYLRLSFYFGCSGSHHYWKKSGILVGCLLSPGSDFVYCHFVCTCMWNLPICLPTILKEFPPDGSMIDQSVAFKPMV